MAENKTMPTGADVDGFLDSIADDRRRADARTVSALLQDITGEPPVMWGPAIVGFGRYHYRYASGRQGEAPAAGFSPRKAALTVYLVDGFDDKEALLAKLGPHTTSQSCLYVKRLDAVDLDVLRELLAASYHRVTTELDAPPDAPEGGA